MTEKDFNYLVKRMGKLQHRMKQLERKVDSITDTNLSEPEFVSLFLEIENCDSQEKLTELSHGMPSYGLNKMESMYFSNLIRNKYNMLLIEELDKFIYDLWEKTGNKKKDKRNTFIKKQYNKAKKGNLISLNEVKKIRHEDSDTDED